MARRLLSLFVLVLLFTGPTMGADVVSIDEGGGLNGAVPEALPVALVPGNIVTGPAEVTAANGNALTVREGGVLEVMAPADGVERFLIQQGIVNGEIAEGVELVTPVGWMKVAVSDTSADVYIEVVGQDRVQIVSNEGIVAFTHYDRYTLLLKDEQGIELWTLPQKGDICFSTRQSNETDVQMRMKINEELDVELFIPKATTGCIEQVDGGEKTRISSDPGSWAEGRMSIDTFKNDQPAQKGSLGPASFALIVNATGEIRMGAEQLVDFAFIERVTLNTEFQVLAASNFFSK